MGRVLDFVFRRSQPVERILCPFHEEQTPSCHIAREAELFHCFGCGRSGTLDELNAALTDTPGV